MMIQIVNGLEMSLAKQYFDGCLVSIKQKDLSFSRTKNNKSNHSKHVKGFSITRGSNIFSISSDIFWLKYSVNTNLKIIIRLKESYKIIQSCC